MSFLDYCFILIFVFALLYLSWRARYVESNRENYFLMGRQLTLPLFVATLVSTWYGGIFGVTQIAFSEGIYAFFTQGVFWYISYLLFAFFIVPKLFVERESLTLPDLVARLVGPKAAKITAIFNLVDLLPVAYVLALGLFLQMLFEIPLAFGMFLGALFVAAYTAWGGFRAVVYTDCLQFGVMFIGVIAVVVFSLWEYGGPAHMWAGLPHSHKEPIGTSSMASFAVWGFIALSTLIDPNFYSRCFAAKSMKTARHGILLSTVFWVVFDLCTTMGALYARAYMPDAEPSRAYLDYAFSILPPGLRGVLVASIAATILSTMDSYLFSGSKIAAKNIFNCGRLIQFHRVFVFSFALVCVLLAQQFSGGFKQIWKFFGSLNGACLLFPVLLAQFVKVRERAFCLGVSFSAVAAIIWEFFLRAYMGVELETFYVGLGVNSLFLGWDYLFNSEI